MPQERAQGRNRSTSPAADRGNDPSEHVRTKGPRLTDEALPHLPELSIYARGLAFI